MIDITLIRTNPELVKENIRRKFQEHKLPLVEEAVELDRLNREAIATGDSLRNQRKLISKQIGTLLAGGKKEEAEKSIMYFSAALSASGSRPSPYKHKI